MSTRVVVPGHEDLNLPGNLTVEQVRNMIGGEISGLASMDGSARAEGTNTVVEFRQRTGTKG